MANPIKSSDLFIDDGSLQLFINKAQELEAAVESLRKEAAKLEKQIIKNNTKTKEEAEGLKKSALRANKLKQAYDKYNLAIAKNATYIQSIKIATREQNNLNKQSAKIALDAAGSYNKLSAQYSTNKIRLNAMSLAQRENTQAGRNLVTQTKAIYTEMQRLQAQTGKNTLNVGNYGKAVNGLWKSFKNLAAVYLSFTGLQNIFSSVFGTTKELDALDLSYRKVIRSSSELAQTQEFLAGVSDRLGIGILDIRKSYLKFRAAAGSTNLSVKQTQKIFESFSKASSILSLSGDDTRGVFKALEQIISKGKVSSEELRLQLGERLPGAFQIMAKSLNVTVGQLDEMLKKGEVLSEDALPKFAAEVERAFGVENLDRVNTLAAAQGRFTTAWVALVDALDAEGVFITVLSFFTSFINVVRRNLSLIGNLTKGLVVAAAAFATYRTSVILATAANKLGLRSTVSYTSAKRLYVVATNLASVATKAFTNALKLNPFALVASLLIGLVTAVVLFNKEAKGSIDILNEIADNATKSISKEKAETELLIKVLNSENATREQKISALDQLKSINADYFGDLKVENGQVKGLTESYGQYIKSIQAAAELKGTTEAISKLSLELDEIDKKIKDTEELTIPEQQGLGGVAATNSAKIAKANALVQLKASRDSLRAQKQALFDLAQIKFEEANTSKKIAEKSGVELSNAQKKRLAAAAKRRTKARDDRQKAEFAETKRRIDEMGEGLKKELALLELELDKKKLIYGNNAEATDALLIFYQNKRIKLVEKFNKEEALKILNTEKEKLDLMADSQEKEIALVENAKQRKLLDSDNEVLIEAQAARKIAAIKEKYRKKEEDERDRVLAEWRKGEEEQFKLQEDLDRAKFLSEKRSTDEIAAYNLKAKVRELKNLKLLEETFNKDLTADQLALINARIVAAQVAVDNATNGDDKKEGKSIYDLLGLNLNDKEEAAISQATSFAFQQVQDVQKAKVQAANQNLTIANQEVATAQRTLQAEIANRNAGYANNVTSAEKDLELAKKTQEKATKVQEKAVEDQRRLDTITQASSLITAAAGIWKNIGAVNPFLAAGAIALMFGSFIAAKIKAKNITKKTLGKGGYETIGGGSHASGNDTFVGNNTSGENVYAQSGETMGVFKRKSVKRYGSRIKDLVNSINAGTLDKHLATLNQASDGIPVFNLANSNNTDMTTTESELRKIRQQGETKFGVNSKGQRFEQRKNILTTYIQ